MVRSQRLGPLFFKAIEGPDGIGRACGRQKVSCHLGYLLLVFPIEFERRRAIAKYPLDVRLFEDTAQIVRQGIADA